MEIKPYTAEQIDDVVSFEKALRQEDAYWGWEIDEAYLQKVTQSFQNPWFQNSISLLAYMVGKVVGRIDSTLVCSHFDGSKAYLDWICVLKSCRHKGIAQELMTVLRRILKEQYGADTLVGLIASNQEAQRFYRSLDHALIRDEGIWINLV